MDPVETEDSRIFSLKNATTGESGLTAGALLPGVVYTVGMPAGAPSVVGIFPVRQPRTPALTVRSTFWSDKPMHEVMGPVCRGLMVKTSSTLCPGKMWPKRRVTGPSKWVHPVMVCGSGMEQSTNSPAPATSRSRLA